MAETPGSSTPPTRRTVFAAAGGAGLAAVLTACGSDSDSGSAADAPSQVPSDTGSPSDSSTAASPSSGAGGGDGVPLGKTADIPVGGGKIFADHKVVVTQPTAGDFKGFSAVCPHRGCAVTSVTDGMIYCPCHGSKFRVTDGSVAHGPSTAPLPVEAVTVSGDTVSLT